MKIVQGKSAASRVSWNASVPSWVHLPFLIACTVKPPQHPRHLVHGRSGKHSTSGTSCPYCFRGVYHSPWKFVPFICCKLVYRQIHSRYQGYAGVGYYGSVDVICSLLPSTVLRLVTTMLYHGKSHQIAMTYVNTVWYLI